MFFLAYPNDVVVHSPTPSTVSTAASLKGLTKKDDAAIEKALAIGGHVGMRFLPIWLQSTTREISEALEGDGLSLDVASDTAMDFVLGQLGHPRYQGPRYTQYKTKGLVRSPYETLF